MAPRAENRMGRWGAVSYIVGNIIGSGIFITPATILSSTQSVGLSLLIWLLSGAIATLGAYCYVELGTSIRRSGGDFAYLCHVRWNFIAFAFMACGCILTFPLTLAIQAETFSEYFLRGMHIQLECHPQWAQLLARKFIGYGLCWLLLFLNFFSLRSAVARFQIVCSLAKLLSIGLIIGTGMFLLVFHAKTENLHRPFANSNWSPAALTNAFFAGLFSYDGWDILNFGAEEVNNPGKSMVFAIPVGIISVACLYISVNLAYFVVLPVQQIQESTAVATTFAASALGQFQSVIPFLVCIVLVGSLNSTLFVASRYLHAAAREHQLPAFLACTNKRHDSPRTALAFHLALAILFSFLGSIDQLISYVSFAMWLQRAFTMCALLRLRFWPSAHMQIHPEATQTPLLLPLTFFAVCLALVGVTLSQDFGTSAVGLAMLGMSLLVFALFLWDRALPRFDCYRKCAQFVNGRFAGKNGQGICWFGEIVPFLADEFCKLAQIVFNGQIKLDDGNDDDVEKEEEKNREEESDEEEEADEYYQQQSRPKKEQI